MKHAKRIISYLAIFALSTTLLTAALVAVAIIPKDNIRKNMVESAQYMRTKTSSYRLIKWIRSSSVDYFADCILLNIVSSYDNSHPVESVMWSSFYGYPNTYAADYLLESAKDDAQPDQEYLRYWHGSAVLVKIFHLFINIHQIYTFHAALLAGLLMWLLLTLWSKRLISEVISLVIAFSAAGIWFVPYCLEYTWVFLIMLIASIVVVKMVDQEFSNVAFGIFFLTAGMATVYLDFLSTETLTLLIPLLLVLRLKHFHGHRSILKKRRPYFERMQRNGIFEKEKMVLYDERIFRTGECWIFTMRSCVLWLVGYLGMWVMKWVIASIVLKQNVMPYVVGHIEERLYGKFGVSGGRFLVEAVTRNLMRLFPFDYQLPGAVFFVIFIVVFLLLPVFKNRLRLRKEINVSMFFLNIIVGLIPIIRFLVLHNHSWRHCNFTYRALAGTVLALCFATLELVEYSSEAFGIKTGKN